MQRRGKRRQNKERTRHQRGWWLSGRWRGGRVIAEPEEGAADAGDGVGKDELVDLDRPEGRSTGKLPARRSSSPSLVATWSVLLPQAMRLAAHLAPFPSPSITLPIKRVYTFVPFVGSL